MAVKRAVSYNKPSRRQALLEIRRLIVEEGLSHQEIQLRLNIPARTYFNWLDMLFEEEERAIRGNGYTSQRLLNETLILQQRYLRRARQLTEIANDKSIDPEQRIAAINLASDLERAVHDMTYMSPAYLRSQGLLPNLNEEGVPRLTLSRLETKEQAHSKELELLQSAAEYRKEHYHQQQQQND